MNHELKKIKIPWILNTRITSFLQSFASHQCYLQCYFFKLKHHDVKTNIANVFFCDKGV